MACIHRQPTLAVERIKEQPHAYEFYQAVRNLECIDHLKDHLIFNSYPSLAYATTDIVKLEENTSKEKDYHIKLLVSFMGLAYQSGVLPEHFTDSLLCELRNNNAALHEFLEIFNHRCIRLLYECWKQNHFFVNHTHAQFTQLLCALSGTTTGFSAKCSNTYPLYYTGLYNQRVRSRQGLSQILSDFFQVEIQLENYKGQWIELSNQDISQLTAPHTHGHNQLGDTLFLGQRAWQVESAFLVSIGPITYKKLQSFLPTQEALIKLKEIISSYVGMTYDFFIKIKVQSNTISPLKLKNRNRLRLGWNSWLSHASNGNNPAMKQASKLSVIEFSPSLNPLTFENIKNDEVNKNV